MKIKLSILTFAFMAFTIIPNLGISAEDEADLDFAIAEEASWGDWCGIHTQIDYGQCQLHPVGYNRNDRVPEGTWVRYVDYGGRHQGEVWYKCKNGRLKFKNGYCR